MSTNYKIQVEIALDSKNFNELKYVTSTYPVTLINKESGNICFWNKELNAWCISYYSTPDLLVCDNFHHAMQKLVEPE